MLNQGKVITTWFNISLTKLNELDVHRTPIEIQVVYANITRKIL